MLANQDRRYEGSELDLFAHAQNWKSYFRRAIAPYIGQRVVEVGAGNGSTTEVLSSVPHEAWFALEPDPDLLASIERKLTLSKLPKSVIPRAGSLSQLRPGPLLDTV